MIHGSLQKRARAALQNPSESSADEPDPAAAESRETGEGPSDSSEQEETAPYSIIPWPSTQPLSGAPTSSQTPSERRRTRYVWQTRFGALAKHRLWIH
ncbi:hypothetical protein JG688_00014785 [Phytophthora aleatoria]|uniref:Uncharacterized protein n=1 Tax=Phytophthora aleatoria TaxID=2496075 RepID=A0A8J5M049_9STRA|nr:hypothetical protein JG688_00014785 [Phytophthora aleatoria]